MITWNTAEKSLNFVSTWVARYGSFVPLLEVSIHCSKCINKYVRNSEECAKIIIYATAFWKGMKIYIELLIPVLCSKHLTLFRVLCRAQALSREPIFLHVCQVDVFSDPTSYQNTWEKNANCCQCQGTAAEQSCEPCPWSWMIFFISLKWYENSKGILLGIKMCQKGKHGFAVVLIRLFCCNESCFVLQSVGHEWVLRSP